MTQKIINLYNNKNFTGYYCLEPFITVHIETDGVVSMCPCPAWGKTQIGNILDTTLESMLASPLAQDIRQSIIDGTYRYCNEKKCAIIINKVLNTKDTLPPNVLNLISDSSKFDMPYEIMFNGDLTCNLSCPSCRTGVIKVSPEKQLEQEAIGEIIYNNIFSRPTDRKIRLVTSGSGEVFASPMLLSFLNKINNMPNLMLSLHTNGLLAERTWHKIAHLESNIDAITVSVDGATAATYEAVRRGGKWEDINNALAFLQRKKHEIGFEFKTRMIVQKTNYKEAVDFYHMSKRYDVDRVEYSRLHDWYSWSKIDFKKHDVFNPTHLEHDAALEYINQVKQYPDAWFEGNFV